MKISRPHWYLAAAALLIVAVLAYAFAPRPVPVELARAAAGPLRVTIDEDGRTRIRERYVVSAPLGGHLRRIELHPGDAVIAGKTRIATIEPAAPELLDPRTRAQLEARRQVAETQVQLAGPRIERARAAQELALSELARAETLAAEQALSRQEFDRVREASRAANEELKSAEYARQIAGFELEQARAALLRSTPDTARGDHTWELCVTSPIDGRVLRVFHEDAAVVPTSARLVEVGNPTDLEAEVDVLSSDAVRIRPGARVLFEHWGGDRPLEAACAWLNQRGSRRSPRSAWRNSA
jgi:HlyD family secretion protein